MHSTLSQASITPPVLTLNLTGLPSPGPLPPIKKAMDKLRDGQIVMVLSDYPSIEPDLIAWTKQRHQILAIDKNRQGGYAFYIMKGDPCPVERQLDTDGAPCPMPVVRASAMLGKMDAGETLKLVSRCPAAPEEVRTWAHTCGYRLLGTTQDAFGVHRFYIQK